MREALLQVRWITIIAVIGSVVGATLMLFVGAVHTIEAVGVYFGFMETKIFSGEKLIGVDAMVKVVSALDNFIFGLVLYYFAFGIYRLFLSLLDEQYRTPLVLYYFAFGIYTLFLSPEPKEETTRNIPKSLQVTSLGQMKKTLLEVIIVLLAVLFLKDILYLQKGEEMPWTVLVLPAAVLAFGITLKLVEFDKH